MINILSSLARRSVRNKFLFSEYYDQRDKSEIVQYYHLRSMDQRYIKLSTKWQIDLERKRVRRAKKLELEKTRVAFPDCYYLLGTTRIIPMDSNAAFAVCIIGARQYKVTKDDLVISEKLKGLDINTTIELDKVMMVGTRDYTALGRPFIGTAKVIATVEQQTQTDKEIVFKKKRRKRYMKSYGHRQEVTILRINDIIHDVSNLELGRAVSLI